MDIASRIKKWELEAEVTHRSHYAARHLIKSVRPPRHEISIYFVSESPEQLESMMAAYELAIGKLERGNSRRGGNRWLYANLVRCFVLIKSRGLKLPRWSISKKHSDLGLFEVLKANNYILAGVTQEMFSSSPKLRKQVHHKVERIFVRVADAIEAKPPQK